MSKSISQTFSGNWCIKQRNIHFPAITDASLSERVTMKNAREQDFAVDRCSERRRSRFPFWLHLLVEEVVEPAAIMPSSSLSLLLIDRSPLFTLPLSITKEPMKRRIDRTTRAQPCNHKNATVFFSMTMQNARCVH